MKTKKAWMCIGVMGVLLLCAETAVWADVSIALVWQQVAMTVTGDGGILDHQEEYYDSGGDTDLYAEASYGGDAFGAGNLKTAYTVNSLTVDGMMQLDVWPTIDYDELSVEGDIYYYSTITVTDTPVWVTIKGYLTTDRNHAASDHFLVVDPLGYWDVDYSTGDKVWMVDTGLLDVGAHNVYGGVHYTLTAETGGTDKFLYADYYFVIETSSVFDPSRADLNNDGKVNLEDLALLASAWLWGVGGA